MLKVFAPAQNKVISEMKETSATEVEQMILNARETFPQWSQLSMRDRLRYFTKLYEILVNDMQEIAAGVSESTGKVRIEAISADVSP